MPRFGCGGLKKCLNALDFEEVSQAMNVWNFFGECGKINACERRISHEEIAADYETAPHIADGRTFGAYILNYPPDTSKRAAGFC